MSVALSGVGARRTHPEVRNDLGSHGKQPHTTSKNLTCIQAALVNATIEVAGDEASKIVEALVELDRTLWRKSRK